MIRNIIPFKKAHHMSVWTSIVITAKQLMKPIISILKQNANMTKKIIEEKRIKTKITKRDDSLNNHLITQVISTGSLPSCHPYSKSTRQWSWSKINMVKSCKTENRIRRKKQVIPVLKQGCQF